MRRGLRAAMVAALILYVSAISAAALGPIRSETRYAGPYILRVDLYSDPSFTGKRLDFDVVVSASTDDQLRGLTVTASAIPEAGTNGTPVRASVSPARQSGGFQGYVTMQVRGDWRLQLTVRGLAGTNTVDLLLRVAAPTAIPIWLAWSIGLAPLAVLMGFGVSQRSYLARLQRAASQASPAASIPVVT